MLLSPKEVDLHQKKAKNPHRRKRNPKEKAPRKMLFSKDQKKRGSESSKMNLRGQLRLL